MNPPDPEVQKLEEIYQSLECRIQEPALATDEYLKCIAGLQVDEASRLVASLVRKTSRQNARADRASQIAALCGRIGHILELAEKRAEELRLLQTAACEELRELQTGGQFLQSMQGYRENHPKFVDARH
jgi:hypothetical protein